LSDSEHHDALPVLAEVSEVRPVQPQPPRTLAERIVALPAPVLAAAGGFLAGVATFVLFRLRSPSRRLRVGKRRGKKIEIAESRSFLVDIHLLKR
jgi:anti-sigma factor RsiW